MEVGVYTALASAAIGTLSYMRACGESSGLLLDFKVVVSTHHSYENSKPLIIVVLVVVNRAKP